MYYSATIRWIKKETRDTSTYALNVKGRFTFTPGQFNMISVPGIGEAPISISSSPKEHEVLHTIRVAGDVTTAISRLNVGDTVLLRGPFGVGWPLNELKDRQLMIISGGMGIAPLRSVIREFIMTKRTFPKKPLLLYGSKTPKDIIFRDEFPRFRDVFDIFMSVDRADPEMVWRGYTGLVTDLLNKVYFEPLNTVVFICGPEAMMKNTIMKLLQSGVPPEKVYLSMERNMNCGIGICGHCLFGPRFVCKDGPVFRYSKIMDFLEEMEL